MQPGLKNMTAGRPAPLILAFALPLMAGNVCQQLYTVVDTMVVGRVLGVDALAALGAVDWLNWLMLGLVQGLTQGFAIPMAQHFGADRRDLVRGTVGCAAVLAALSSLVLTGAGQIAIRPVLALLRTPADILPGGTVYLHVMFAGTPVVMAYNLLACVLRSLGDGKTPLQAMLVSSCANIALDVLFVMGFGWGIAGAAAATVIAQGLSGLYCLRRVRRVDFLRLGREDVHLRPAMAARLLALGAPMAVQNCVIAVGGMLLTAIVNGFGVLFIAGYTAANKLYGILEIAATSYGYAMITYVGQNLGAGDVPRVRQGVRTALVIALATSLAIAAAMLSLGRLILAGFISGTPEQVSQAMDVAYQYLAIMSICLPILYLLHVIRSALQGMGDTLLPMVSGLAELGMRTGVALALSRLIGGQGVFYAEVSAWLGADVVLVTAYLVSIRRLSRRPAGAK